MIDVPDIKKAVVFHRTGKYAEAKEIYRQYDRLNPCNDRVLYLWGLIEYRQKNYPEAISLIKQAIAISPKVPEFYKDLGNCYKHMNNYDKAVNQYKRALLLNSRFTEAYYDMGILHVMSNELDSAVDCFKQAIACDSKFTNAYINLSIAYQKKGDYSKVVLLLEQARGLQADNDLIYINLGKAFHSIGKMTAAISAFNKAIALNQNSAEAYFNLGVTHRGMRNYPGAVTCFENALAANPLWEDPYLLIGNVYQQEGKYESALVWFDKILKINPKNTFALAAKGDIFFEIGREEDSLSSYKEAVEVDSEFAPGYSGLIKVMLKTCTWKKIEVYGRILDRLSVEALNNGRKVFEPPFLNLVRHSDSKLNYGIARSYSGLIEKKTNNAIEKYGFLSKRKTKKIHVGYFSNNFRNHPTANLLIDFYKNHNRDDFEISCFSYGSDDESSQRNHIKSTCDNFIDIENMSDIDADKLIRENQVDILVDLVGFLKGSRMDILAFHPASIQIRWLGMAGTTGSNFIDYIITDQTVTPEKESTYYSEKFIYLPQCYQVNSYQSYHLDKTEKTEWGFPSDSFVFCSFNESYKFDPKVFQCWLNIVKIVPKSLLWLFIESDLAQQNLRKMAELNGVESARIHFAKRLPRRMHFQRLACADLALDTFAVSGASTISDALWVNVPVLTVKGHHFAPRMSTKHSISNRTSGVD